MKKVVTVHIANEIFQMEEDGYANIQKILKKIESGSAKGPSLTKDIENRIAAMLCEKASPEKLVTCEQVDEVIDNLGYSAYLKDERSQTYSQSHKSGYKKLYRHPNEKVLGGVCGGIAAYLNTDPVLFRILFVVLFFGFGTGLLLYLIMWIVVPEARTPEQLNDLNN
jgi:phage shock protein PspC (stress-responsive transcriptional regulator)